MNKFVEMSNEDMLEYIKTFRDDAIFAVCELLRRDIDVLTIAKITMITPYFIETFADIVKMERKLAGCWED